MHISPLVLGIDTNILKMYHFTLSRALTALGSNTGNILFAEALFNCIGGAVRSGYSFKPADLEGRDAIVVTAANWINPDSEFTLLLDQLEQTNLPIYVIGLGAQTNDKQTIPKMKPAQERLMRLFADRGATISVRGTFSAEVLEHYGIKNVDVTGCPSMLLMGEMPEFRETVSPEKITLHGTRHWFDNGLPDQDRIYQIAIENGYDLVLQSELAEFYFATQQLDDPKNVEMAEDALSKLYPGRPTDEVKAYLQDRAKVFFDLQDWRNYAGTRDFTIGTRIHGTIASLLGGTRALLLTHDARTEELAEALNIPNMPVSEFTNGNVHDMQALYKLADPGGIVAGIREYRTRFGAFLKRNSLALIKSANLLLISYWSIGLGGVIEECFNLA